MAPASDAGSQTASDNAGAQSPAGGDPSADVAQTGPSAPDPTIAPPELSFAPTVTATAQAAPVPVAETVSRLAAQIVQTAQGATSEFTLSLHPAELGGVQVKIQVDRRGGVSASMTFDNPQSAAELKAHAGDLKAALNQAGFDVSDDGLTFNLNGRGQQNAQDFGDQSAAWARQAFQATAVAPETLLTAVNDAAARLEGARSSSGLDIRI